MKATEKTGLAESFVIPVVITPDTSELSATYSQQPYNRIVVCDALSGKDGAYSEERILDLFERAVMEAALYTVRSKNWRTVHALTGVDLFQPVYLVNVTSAFVSGAAIALSETKASSLTDKIELEYLIQAKIAGKFPSWKQVCGTSDHYVFGAVENAVTGAFSAYLIQRWGIDKFREYWGECGKIHFFALFPCIFRKVYGESLAKIWRDFEDSIEIPSEMTAISVMKNASEQILRAKDLHFQSPVKTSDGIIWFDGVRREVAVLYDSGKKAGKRKKLFSAENVTRLSISADRKYLAVCAYREKPESALNVPYTRIYDIKKRTFLKGSYPLTEACIVCLPYKKYALAGVAGTSQESEMRLYLVNDMNITDILLTRQFASGSVPHQFCSSAKNSLSCIVSEDGEQKLLSISLPEGEEKTWRLPFTVISMQGSDGILAFSYLSEESAFLQTGYFNTTADGTISRACVIKSSRDGGTNDPFIFGSDIFYSVHRESYDELYRLKRAVAPTEPFSLEETSPVRLFERAELPVIQKRATEDENGKIRAKLFMDDTEISRYNPLKYMKRKLVYIGLPITSLDVDDGYKITAGAGFSYFTNEDALENSQVILSYSAYSVDPEDDYTSITGDNIFTAIINNSMLPIKVSLGASWATARDGQYTLTALGGLSYRHPVGYSYQKLVFSLQDKWTASTMHRDRYTKETTELEGWTNLSDTFKDNAVITGISYESYRQSGLSAFEELGLETKISFTYDMDFAQEKQGDDKTIIDVTDSEYYVRTSLSFDYGLKIPRLLPIRDFPRVVLCLPTAAYVSLYGESGTALSWYAETLVIGWETQAGFPGADFYLHRFGLKIGYHGDFEYDTFVVPGPDFAAMREFAEVFTQSELDHYVYAAVPAVFSPIAGVTSKLQLSSDFQLRYYFRKHSWETSLSFKTNL